MNENTRSVAKRLQSAVETGRALGGKSKEAAAMFTVMALNPMTGEKMRRAVEAKNSEQLSEMAEVVPKPYEPIDAAVVPAENPGPPIISTQLLADARRAGLDLNALAPDELDAFASGGVAGLTRYRQNLWDNEADKRPAQPGIVA